MINPNNFSEEFQKAISRLLTLTGADIYGILDALVLKESTDAPYTVPNALAILNFLGTPITETELKESKLLYQGAIPEPHGTVFHKLATRQNFTVEDARALNEAVARDIFIKTTQI